MRPDDGLGARWFTAFRGDTRAPDLAPQLQSAADGARLRPWTELVTSAVVRACHNLGWRAAARGVGDLPLPVPRAEYLAVDVIAFAQGTGWRRPVAAFELENSADDELVAYALWKACTVSVPFACLLCYRHRPEDIGPLVGLLGREVLSSIAPEAEVLVVVGTRSTHDLFPDGCFRRFRWDPAGQSLVAWT